MRINEYLHSTLLFGVLKAGHLVENRLSKFLKPAKLNYMQALVLIGISREKTAIRPGTLQKTFELSSGAISQAITHLVKLRYLERKICSDDARGYELCLSARGRGQAHRLMSILEKLEQELAISISKSEELSCIHVLSTVQNTLRKSLS